MIRIALVCMPILALSPGAGGGEELLRNGGMEAEFRDGIAEGWIDNSRGWADLDVEYARDERMPHGGKACQRIACTRLDYGAVQLVSASAVPLKRGSVYRVRGWLRGNVGMVALQLRQAPSPYRVYVEHAARAGDAWQPVEYFWTSTVDDPKGRFMLRFVEAGVLAVDDLSVEEVTTEEAARLVPPPRAGNLLRNGHFDLELANWLVSHGCDYWRQAELAIETVDGNPCLKLDVPEGIAVTLCSDTVEAAPGRPVRVSCRVRAAEPTDVTFGSSHCGTRARADMGWKTIAAAGAIRFVPQPTDHARLGVRGPATLWIDDVTLRQDEKAQGGDPFQAAILCDRHPLSLYHDGDELVLQLLASASESAGPRELAWSLDDFWGNVRISGSWMPGAGRQRKLISAKDLGRGWYRARVTWDDGRSCSNESTFAILPPWERTGGLADSPFGAHFSVDPSGLALARAVGVRWLRLHPPNHTKWRVVEPKAEGQWAWRDEPIAIARRAGLELIGSLDRCPPWASTAPPGTPDASFYTGTGAWVPQSWDDWETYVTETVRRYKRDIHVWEVWNEPNLTNWLVPREGRTRAEAYVDMLRHTYPVVKREDPEAIVIGGCVAGALTQGSPARKFAWEIIDRGALELMDAFSFHQYISRSIDETSEPIDQWLARLRAKMRAAGREVPIINSEGGYSNPGTSLAYRPCPADTVPTDRMARWLARQYVAQWAAGVRQFFFYNFFIDGSPTIRRWQGFVEGDGQPRPNVAAYAHLSWILDGARFVRTERPDEDAWVHYFDTPRGEVAVAWTKTGSAKTLSFPGAIEAWDLMGAPLSLPADREWKVTDAPIYVRSAKGRAMQPPSK